MNRQPQWQEPIYSCFVSLFLVAAIGLEFDINVSTCWDEIREWQEPTCFESKYLQLKQSPPLQENCHMLQQKSVRVQNRWYIPKNLFQRYYVSVLFNFLYQRKITVTIAWSNGFSACWQNIGALLTVSFRWNRINWQHLICYAHDWVFSLCFWRKWLSLCFYRFYLHCFYHQLCCWYKFYQFFCNLSELYL